MKHPLTLLVALCGIGFTTAPHAMASKTDLTRVGTTVENVNQLLQKTVAHNTKLSGLKTPKITTSYLLGQGLTIAIAPIKFAVKGAGPRAEMAPVTVEGDALQQRNEIEIARKKRTAHRLKAKELAHAAHNLREQGKSLRRSIAEANKTEQAKLTKTLDQVRSRQRSVESARKAHAALAPTPEQANSGPLHGRLAGYSQRQRFYQKLEQDVTKVLCHKAKVFSSIDDQEKISVVYQQGGDKQYKSYNVKGWIVEKSLLSRCGQGVIDQQQLASRATRYQY